VGNGNTAAQPSQPAGNAAPAVAGQPVVRSSSVVNVPLLAGEIAVMVVALGVALFSLRWWRR